MSRSRLLSLVLALGLAATLVGCGATSSGAHQTGSAAGLGPSTRLTDLEDPNRTRPLFSVFNEQRGLPRVILLVSPT